MPAGFAVNTAAAQARAIKASRFIEYSPLRCVRSSPAWAQIVQGDRIGRWSILVASESPTMASCFGSQVTLRSSRTAMSHMWLSKSLRTASAKGLTVADRDFTASTKFW